VTREEEGPSAVGLLPPPDISTGSGHLKLKPFIYLFDHFNSTVTEHFLVCPFLGMEEEVAEPLLQVLRDGKQAMMTQGDECCEWCSGHLL
jgi:hypothetical protein